MTLVKLRETDKPLFYQISAKFPQPLRWPFLVMYVDGDHFKHKSFIDPLVENNDIKPLFPGKPKYIKEIHNFARIVSLFFFLLLQVSSRSGNITDFFKV